MMDTPKRNARTEDWAAYALTQGFTAEQVEGLTRAEIQQLLDTGPRQETEDPAPVDEPGGDAGPAGWQTPAGAAEPDYSRFLNVEDDEPTTEDPGVAVPAEGPEADAPATPEDNPSVTATVEVEVPATVPTGEPAIIAEGGTVDAVVTDGTYQVTTPAGTRRPAVKGTIIRITEDKAARAEALGVIRRL